MDPSRWDKVVELFHAARERVGPERNTLLDSLCEGNRSLRVILDQMLRDDEGSDTFLKRPPAEKLTSVTCAPVEPAMPGPPSNPA